MAVQVEEIEKIVENKLNQFLKEVPNFKRDIKKEIEVEDDFFNFSIQKTYQNTIQTIIDIINDMMMIVDSSDNYNTYYKRFLNIFFNENRMFYIGIIIIIISFIIYFIDGATI